MTLVNSTFDTLGMTFDPTMALLNHSCTPNAAVVFDHNIASVRSIRPISADEQITISYIDNTFKRAIRRQQLRDQYYFECHCEGCEPSTGTFTDRDLWICEHCKGRIPEPLLKGDFTCPQCKKIQTTSLQTLRTLEAKAMMQLDLENSTTMSIENLLNQQLLPTLQSLTSNPSWPVLRQPAPALRYQIYLTCLSTGNLEAAFHHINTLITSPLIDIHPEPFHPLRTVKIFLMGTLLASLAAESNSMD